MQPMVDNKQIFNQRISLKAVWLICLTGGLLCSLDYLLTMSASLLDFRSFYFAAVIADGNGNPYNIELLGSYAKTHYSMAQVLPYLYPPILACLLIPLTSMPFMAANWLWLILQVIVFILLAGQIVTASNRSNSETKAYPLSNVILVILLFYLMSFKNNMQLGQVNFLVLLFFQSCLIFYFRGDRDWLAGLHLSVAVMIKVTPGILLLFFLIRRRYRVVAACLSGMAVLSLLPLIVGRPDLWRMFFEYLPQMGIGQQVEGLFQLSSFKNIGITGYFARMFDDNIFFVRPMAYLVALSMLAWWLLHAVRIKDQTDEKLLLLPLLTLMVISSPYAYPHHVIYTYPAVYWLFIYVKEKNAERYLMYWAGLLILLPIASFKLDHLYDVTVIHPIVYRTLSSVSTIALLIFFFYGLQLFQMRRKNAGAESEISIGRAFPVSERPKCKHA